jgi:large subunit ribosomal protein L24
MKTKRAPKIKPRQNKWIRKGVEVVCVAGNEKGRKGTVLSRTSDRALVQGLNIRKKHMRRQSENEPGRIAEIEVPIHLSNLMLADAEGAPVRTKVRGAGAEKELLSTRNDSVIRSVKKES